MMDRIGMVWNTIWSLARLRHPTAVATVVTAALVGVALVWLGRGALLPVAAGLVEVVGSLLR
jgi:hypothetical protein